MKIVDTFLFSEPFEKEILFLKIMLGANLVDEWLLIENSYTFQGKFKGLFAHEIINEDPRFEPYRHRIKIISENYNPDVRASSDSEAFNVEFWQRDLAENVIHQLSENDYFFISDADECIDSTDAKRKNELLNAIKQHPYGIHHVSCLRYWYDFDNQYEILYGIPLVSVRYFKETGKPISQLRRENIGPCKEKWNNIICFEYSHCISADNIVKKYSSFSHVGTTLEDIKEGLNNNCRVLSADRKHLLSYGPKYFFKTVQLNAYNSPAYVRSNLAALKTNTISINYLKNRKEHFPFIFTFKNQVKYYCKSSVHFLLKRGKDYLKKIAR